MPNVYETGEQKIIPAVLVYLRRSVRDGKIGDGGHFEYLFLHRCKKQNDIHEGKWNGLGGKLELGESPFEAAIREVREESGIELERAQLELCGVLQFPNFKASKKEDWWVTVFSAEVAAEKTGTEVIFSNAVESFNSAEGQLKWIAEADVLSLNLWEGDQVFLPYVLRGEKFFGSFWYEDGKLARQEMLQLNS